MSVEIPLTRGYVAIVDEEDVEKLRPYKWRVGLQQRCVYAQTTVATEQGRKTLFMHRLLCLEDTAAKVVVDHINGNGLDNRKANLRPSSKAQNGWNKKRPINTNTSGVTGVVWQRKHQNWGAEIFVNGKRQRIGFFKDKGAAIAARREAEAVHYGEFAPRYHSDHPCQENG